MTTITLKPNTIRDRGLPAILEQHLWWRDAWPMFAEIGVVEVGRRQRPDALDTVVWFAYGKQPLAFPENIG